MSLFLALIAIIFAGRLILKKYNPQAVLILTGLLLTVTAHLLGYIDVTTLVKKSTGLSAFDLFENIRDTFSSRAGGLGLQIMLIGAFAMYMSHIGASQVLVRVSSRPLQKLNSPYLLLGLAFILGQFLSLFISSAAGLGLLLMATLYPVLVGLGCSRAAVVAVIASTCCVEFGPASGNSNFAADLLQIPVIDYFVDTQIPVAVPLIIFVALIHVVVQRFFDSRIKDDAGDTLQLDEKAAEEIKSNAPVFYLLLPMLPLVLMLIGSKIVSENYRITLDTAVLISLSLCMFIEYLRLRNAQEVMKGLQTVFSGMGKIFATVVTLIVAGETFATGLKSIGAIDALINMANSFGLSAAPIVLLMALLTFLISALMGSGNAAFFSFAPMIPDIGRHIGGDISQMLMSVQMSSAFGRTISPIAGVIIAVSGIAGLSPIDVVKRTFIPMVVGWLAMLTLSFARSGQLLSVLPYLGAIVVIIIIAVIMIRKMAGRTQQA